MGLSGIYNSPVANVDGITTMKHAFSKGITFFNTADVYGPHTNEVLLGKYGHPRFQADNLEKSKIIYSRIQKLAEKHRCSTAQLSLAWIRGQGDDVVPIPGATKVKNLYDNIESFKVRLTKEDVKEISDMVPVDAAAGNNVPEIFIPCSWKFADTPQRDGGRPS
ncbi:hypothetical protein ACFX10_010567 [Malus domestica]